jgi:hypothetical protein
VHAGHRVHYIIIIIIVALRQNVKRVRKVNFALYESTIPSAETLCDERCVLSVGNERVGNLIERFFFISLHL